jgi:beta-lactamase regulating signal transducer with metallopeptidase domain
MNLYSLTLLLPATAAGVVLFSLIDAAAKSLVLLLVAALVCLSLRRAPAAARHLVWLSALAAALAMPALSMTLPRWRTLPPCMNLAREQPSVSLAAPRINREVGADPAALAEAPHDLKRQAATPHGPKSSPPVESMALAQPWRPGPRTILLVWGCGAALALLPMARAAWVIARLNKASSLTARHALAAATIKVADDLRIAAPRLHLGPPGAMPMVWGVFRGHVLLPAEAIGWDTLRLRAVLLHELAHLRRRDPLALVIAQLARALYWFNPLAWLAVVRLRVERERACDDYVLRGGVKPSDYAKHVLELATRLRPLHAAPPIALAMADRLRIEKRLQTILDAARNRRAVSRRVVLAVLLATGSAATSLSMLSAAHENKPRPAPLRADTPVPHGQESQESAEGPVVMGLDLSTLPSVSHVKDLPDLFEPIPDQPGKWRPRPGIFVMVLDDHAWLQYPASRGRFYIEYRTDRDKPETERTYGPIVGDPFERFDLEAILLRQARSEDPSAGLRYAAKMLRTDDAKMARRAMRLIEAAVLAERPELYWQGLLQSTRSILDEHAATLKKHGLEAPRAQVKQRLESLEAKIETRTVEIPENQYGRAVGHAPEVPEAIHPEAWGETVDGLRLAAVLGSNAVRGGDQLGVHLVVENASDRDIKFSTADLLQSARAEVRRTNGDAVETRLVVWSIYPVISRYVLEPDERIVLATPSVKFVEQFADGLQSPGCSQAIAAPGVYLVRYRFHLGSPWRWARGDGEVMRRFSPAKGEWKGELASGTVRVTVLQK